MIRIIIAASAAVTFAAPSLAQVAGDGTVDYEVTVLETRPLNNGNSLRLDQLQGVVQASDETHPLHGTTQDCLGQTVLNADSMIEAQHGVCSGVDADGDVYWLAYRITPGGESGWLMVNGTGKYVGGEGQGTSTVVSETDASVSITWEGSVTLP